MLTCRARQPLPRAIGELTAVELEPEGRRMGPIGDRYRTPKPAPPRRRPETDSTNRSKMLPASKKATAPTLPHSGTRSSVFKMISPLPPGETRPGRWWPHRPGDPARTLGRSCLHRRKPLACRQILHLRRHRLTIRSQHGVAGRVDLDDVTGKAGGQTDANAACENDASRPCHAAIQEPLNQRLREADLRSDAAASRPRVPTLTSVPRVGSNGSSRLSRTNVPENADSRISGNSRSMSACRLD